jgi:subtilisin family serine protease/predicted small lipoprotein YifL
MRTWTLLFSLALAGCGLEGPRVLRLTLPQAELTAQAGSRVELPVEVEARRVRARLWVEGLPEGFAPPPLPLEEGKRRLTLSLEAREPGTYSARVVAEGEGLRREAAFRLVVSGRPESLLEGVVYVGVAQALAPQGVGGGIRPCPEGCPGKPLGGGWYRMPGGGLPDRPVRAQGQGEPLVPRQWGLALAGFPEAWARGRGEGVVVAVPDTGVLRAHPDLQGALLPGLDLVDGDTDPEEPVVGGLQSFHGSHVASIAAAPWNGVGMAGASQARLLPIRLLDTGGSGRESDLILALRWAAGLPVEGLPPNPHPAQVVNLSLAGAGPCSAPLQEAIDEARARGVLVVAAAGNQGEDYRGYFPANCRGVLPVGAVGPDGRLAPYSNRGAPLLAPGGNLGLGLEAGVLGAGLLPGQGMGWRYLQGTSQAAPHAAAALALLLGMGADPDAALGALLAGAREGLLHLPGALLALEGGGAVLEVAGSLDLRPGEAGALPVRVLSPTPVPVEVYPEGGLSAYLFPNPAKGEATLRVYAPGTTPPGLYRVRLRARGAEASAEVRVAPVPAARVVLEACPLAGDCVVLTLPREGGPFRLEVPPGPHRLLAFLDGDGDGVLDREEPWAEAQVSAPARGVRLLVR